VIAFPDANAARAWYASPAYQALLPLRRRNAEGEVFLIAGVREDHRAMDILDSGPEQQSRIDLNLFHISNSAER
jgi:hypothetical protein